MTSGILEVFLMILSTISSLQKVRGLIVTPMNHDEGSSSIKESVP